MRSSRCVAYAAALAPVLTSAATSGASGPEPAALRVDCPALSTESKAAIEARVEAQLLAASRREGNVTVACGPASVIVNWIPVDRAQPERHVTLDAGVEGLDDRILEAVHAFFASAETPPPPPAPRVALIEPTVSPTVAKTVTPAAAFRVAGLAGADLEVWHGGVTFALGVTGGVVLWPSRRWAVTLLVAPEWAVAPPNGFDAWGLRGIARVEYEVASHVEVGIGPTGRGLWVSAVGTNPGRLAGVTGGLNASLRVTMTLGRLELEAGPTVEALLRPIAVDLAKTEAFRVPSVVAGLGLSGIVPSR